MVAPSFTIVKSRCRRATRDDLICLVACLISQASSAATGCGLLDSAKHTTFGHNRILAKGAAIEHRSAGYADDREG